MQRVAASHIINFNFSVIMKILEFIYNEKSISFDPQGNDNVMVNATEMAKVFGKRLDHFLKTDHAKEFISELELTPFGGSSKPLTREEIIKTVNGVNTWMHRILALKFAAWLDVKFEIWVWNTIDKILLEHYREVKAAMYEKMAAEKALDIKRKQLLIDNPEFIEFLELEGKITEAEKKRQKAIKASMAQFKIEFAGK